MGFSRFLANQNHGFNSKVFLLRETHAKKHHITFPWTKPLEGETPVAHLNLRTIDCSSRTYSSSKISRTNGKVVVEGIVCFCIVCKTGGRRHYCSYYSSNSFGQTKHHPQDIGNGVISHRIRFFSYPLELLQLRASCTIEDTPAALSSSKILVSRKKVES
mmetsp:Transcript_19121/g.47561  ORF Transcript_19121/g.47561 Transcript_19121/m.47561 type:complete len:160 (-) Transcript_19121:4316-4795(-)